METGEDQRGATSASTRRQTCQHMPGIHGHDPLQRNEVLVQSLDFGPVFIFYFFLTIEHIPGTRMMSSTANRLQGQGQNAEDAGPYGSAHHHVAGGAVAQLGQDAIHV